MSDGLDRKVALKKNRVLFLTLSKLLKIVCFFLISSNCKNTGVTFNLLMRKKNLEVIISDRYMSDGEMRSFLQLFSTLKKLA